MLPKMMIFRLHTGPPRAKGEAEQKQRFVSKIYDRVLTGNAEGPRWN